MKKVKLLSDVVLATTGSIRSETVIELDDAQADELIAFGAAQDETPDEMVAKQRAKRVG